MIDFKLWIEQDEQLAALAEVEMEHGPLMLHVLETVGWDVITYLRSHTGKTQPPLLKTQLPRPAHPGGWADISSNLANAYRFEIWASGRKVRWSEEGDGQPGTVAPVVVTGEGIANPEPPFQLVLINSMEYAVYLEAMEGYFVLNGVTQPGGPIERAILAAATAIGWEVIQ